MLKEPGLTLRSWKNWALRVCANPSCSRAADGLKRCRRDLAPKKTARRPFFGAIDPGERRPRGVFTGSSGRAASRRSSRFGSRRGSSPGLVRRRSGQARRRHGYGSVLRGDDVHAGMHSKRQHGAIQADRIARRPFDLLLLLLLNFWRVRERDQSNGHYGLRRA